MTGTKLKAPLTDHKVVLLQELAAGVVVVLRGLANQSHDYYPQEGDGDGAKKTHMLVYKIHPSSLARVCLCTGKQWIFLCFLVFLFSECRCGGLNTWVK